MANSANPDQRLVSDLDLHYLLRSVFLNIQGKYNPINLAIKTILEQLFKTNLETAVVDCAWFIADATSAIIQVKIPIWSIKMHVSQTGNVNQNK